MCIFRLISRYSPSLIFLNPNVADSLSLKKRHPRLSMIYPLPTPSCAGSMVLNLLHFMTKIFTIGFFIEKKNGTIWGGDAWKPVPGIRENHPEKSLEFFFKKRNGFFGENPTLKLEKNHHGELIKRSGPTVHLYSFALMKLRKLSNRKKGGSVANGLLSSNSLPKWLMLTKFLHTSAKLCFAETTQSFTQSLHEIFKKKTSIKSKSHMIFVGSSNHPCHQCMVYFTYIWLIFVVNVSNKNTYHTWILSWKLPSRPACGQSPSSRGIIHILKALQPALERDINVECPQI